MKPFLMLPVIPLITLSCATRQSAHYWYSDGGLTVKRIEAVLRENPPQPDQNIQIVALGHSDGASHHIVEIRDAEALHAHKSRDLTAFIYRGNGAMTVVSGKFDVG